MSCVTTIDLDVNKHTKQDLVDSDTLSLFP